MEPLLDPEFEELERELLRAGREVKMSPALQAKTLAALGVGAAGVTVAATAKAGTLGWLSSKASMTWGVTVLGGVAVAGVVALNVVTPDGGGSTSREERPAVAVTETAPVEAPLETGAEATNAEVSEAAPEEIQPVEPLEKAEPAISHTTKAPSNRRQVAPKSVKKSGGLAEELAHLKRVETALRAGQPAQALAHLSEYRNEFPRRQLGLEAEVLTIQALYESGSRAAANSRAQRFVEKYPQSPLGTRARQYLK
jgi:hypothetical protein